MVRQQQVGVLRHSSSSHHISAIILDLPFVEANDHIGTLIGRLFVCNCYIVPSFVAFVHAVHYVAIGAVTMDIHSLLFGPSSPVPLSLANNCDGQSAGLI